MAKDTTTRFRVDISNLKKNITEANRLIKMNNSEFKASTAGMNDWSKSADGLSAKLKQLDGNLTAEKTKLKSLEEQYKLVAKEQGENSKGAQDLIVKINNQKAVVQKTEAQINKYNTQLTEVKKAEEQAQSATGKLTKAIEEQETELKKLKDKYAEVTLSEGKNSDKAKELRDDIEKLSKNLNDNKTALKNAKSEADKLDKSIENVDETSKEAGSSSGGVSTFNVAMGNLASDGIKAVFNGLKECVEIYKEVDEGHDNLIKKTGATGESAKKLTEAYKNASKEVLGDFSDLGNAAGEINTRFNFEDKELTDATVTFTKFAKLNEIDVTSAVQKTAKAMANAGIESKNYADVLDVITLAGQKTGVSVDALLDNYVKYGATFKDLNYSQEEAIALMSQTEKEGLDLNIILSGLRKANVNLAKEGKNSDKELGKVFKQIKNAKNPTKATEKAIEIFGTKAGPDLAQAIRKGKISIEEMSKALNKSKGTVKKTYESTQDGTDKIALAWQNAKTNIADFTGNLLKKYSPDITKAIEDIEEGGEDALTWIVENLDKIIPILKGIGTELLVVFTANKVSSFTSSVAGMITTFKSLKTATDGATTSQKLLNLAQSSNPIGMVITIIGTLITAYMTLSDVMGTAEDDTQNSNFDPDVEEAIEKVDELTEAYKDYRTTVDNAFSDVSSEWDYYEKLWNELQGIVDQNGKIKKGYENRAKFISGELSSATGAEIEINKNVIKSYKKVRKEVDNLLISQKALAIQKAYSSEVTNAQKSQTEESKALAKANSERKKVRENILKYNTELKTAEREYNTAKKNSADGGSYNGGGGGVALAKAQDKYNEAKKKRDDELKAESELTKKISESQRKLAGYKADIENYTQLGAAIASNNTDEIQTALTNMQNHFQTASTGTEETLKTQRDQYKQSYEEMKLAVQQGVEGITQADVNEMKRLYIRSNNELKTLRKAKKNGTKNIYDVAKSETKKGNKEVKDEAHKGNVELQHGVTADGKVLGEKTDDVFTKVTEKNKKGGRNAGQATADGLKSKEPLVKRTARELINKARTSASSVKSIDIGINFVSGIITGLKNVDILSSLVTSAKSVAKKAYNTVKDWLGIKSPSRKTAELGKYFMQGFEVGVDEESSTTIKNTKKKFGELIAETKKATADSINIGTYGYSGNSDFISIPKINNPKNIGGGSATTVINNYSTNNNTTNNNFTQNNTSPKALDTLEVYRQTNNLLNM